MNNITTVPQLITAQWVVPVVSQPIENAAVVMRDGKIETVCRQDLLKTVYTESELRFLKSSAINYGSAIITPGLINLHTHLDYSSLKSLYNDNEESMFEWLPKLVQSSWGWSPVQWRASAIDGIRESLQAGTSCLIDNSFTGQSAKIIAQTGMRAIIGLELFGQDETLAETAWRTWLEKYERLTSDPDPQLQEALKTGLIKLTVSPHSPYTVAPALWKLANKWADENSRPVLAHLAESINECAWIGGEDESISKYLAWMRDLQAKAGMMAYKTIDAPKTPWRSRQQTPCQLLDANGLLNQRLIATHAVQVTDADINLLRRRAVSVVHCIRSNQRLRHGLAPLKKFREAGLTLGLGTDSLASSPDLSMLSEANQVAQQHKMPNGESVVNHTEALGLITLSAAQVIGLDKQIGSLEKGKIADVAVFQYGKKVETDPVNALFSSETKAVTVYVGGRIARLPA